MSKPLYHVKVYVGAASVMSKGLPREEAVAVMSVLQSVFQMTEINATPLIVVKFDDIDAVKEEIING